MTRLVQKKFTKRHLLISLIIIVLVFINGFGRWRPIETALLSPLVFLNIVIQEGEWRPLDLIFYEPVIEEHNFLSSSGRTLTADLYLPRFGEPDKVGHPAFIVHVPFAGGGLRDPRLVNIGKTFARAGFAVFIPWRNEDQGILSEKDIEDVISSFGYLSRHPKIDPARIGLFGISYGNGPTILAAANPAISERVHFVVSFAGYYELKNAMRFVVSSKYQYKDISEVLEPEQWVKDLLKDNLKARGLPPETIDKFFEEPENFDLILASLQGFEEKLHNFSPASVIDRLKAPFLITHSTGDITIPYTESMRLADALAEKVPTTLALVKIFIHGNIRPLSWQTWRENYLPSLRDSLNFVYQLLSYRWR